MHKIALIIITAILVCTPSLAFSAEGDLDTTFGQSGVVTFNKGGGSFAEAMALQPDGRKIIVGTVSGVLNSDILVMRLNQDGTRDISFGLDGIVIFNGPSNSGDAAMGVALRPDGRIVVAGLTSNGTDDDILVFQLNRDGARDISFGTLGVAQFDMGGNEAANDVVLMPDGRVVLTGTASNATDNDIIIMRLTNSGLPDTSFGGTGFVLFDRGGNDSGRAVALLPDNRIVVSGQSSNGLNGDLIVLRVNLGGGADISFGGIGGDVAGSVTYDNGGRDAGNAVAIQADGRIVVAGTSSNGVSDDLLVLRLLQNGVRDISFSSIGGTPGVVLVDGVAQGSDVANAITIQNNGKIVVTGFSSNGTVADVIVVRLNADGVRDISFGGDGVVTYHASDFGDAEGNAVIIQPDNYILVAGTGANRLNDFVLVLRFNPNGLLDPTFNAGGVFTFRQRVNTSESGNAVALLPNGRIVVAGQTASGVSNDVLVMKFRSDGSRDTSFSGDGIAFFDGGGGSNDIARGVAVQSDNKVVVAGQTSNGVNNDVVVLRYGTDGRLDASFNVDGVAQFNGGANNDDVGRAVAAANGKVVVVGQTSNGVDNDLLVLRYNGIDGALDTTFGTGGVVTFGGVGNESGYAVAIQEDGMIVVAGVSSNGTNTDLLLLRFDTNGALDNTFDADGVATYDSGSNDAAMAVAVQPDGKIVVAGFSFNGTKNVALVARFSSAGIPDASFSTNGIARFNSGDSNGDETANAVAVQSDGKIVVAGFTNAADVLVLRYLGDGVLDSSFGVNGVTTYNGAANGIDIGNALALQPDGKIVVAGETNGDLLVLRFIGQKVRLLTPNGGEVVPAASTQTNFITWAAPPKAVTFTLELSLDGGTTWSNIANNLTGTIYPSWAVPTPLGNKRECLVRVTGFDGNNAVVSADVSDAVFTIEVVKLTFPDGVPPPAVQSFTTGDPITITWTTVATKRAVDSVKLFYTLNNGTTWISIPGVPIGNPGSFAWTAPSVPATRPKSRVKVVLKDSNGVTLGSDISDYKFTINP